MYDTTVDYGKQIAQMAVNKAVTAEREIHNGMSVQKAIKEFGYGDARRLFAAISRHGVLPPLSASEKVNIASQIGFRTSGNGERARIAKAIGLKQDTVDAWRFGSRSPAPCILTNLARALGITRDELLAPVSDNRFIGASKHNVKKAIPEPLSVPDAKHEQVDAPKAEPIEGAQASAQKELRIETRKTAFGVFGEYTYDGNKVTVHVLTTSDGKILSVTPDELFSLGEELQNVATGII